MAERYLVTLDRHGLSLEGRSFTEKQILDALTQGFFTPGMRFRRGRAEFLLTRTGLEPIKGRTRARQDEEETADAEEEEI